uniref:PH domain-containing protein n=1 Tax=Pinguiococcus pyrenoidosus TaxID=172671 RepID=A0A7R9U398_9STRA|mmetsp:Transcript_12506/g.46266  ORF Transcript_12506/g.46266 Transcript_12506/m.46266 type:complete len:1029 (+) Transcript_12506:274-3360(+)
MSSFSKGRIRVWMEHEERDPTYCSVRVTADMTFGHLRAKVLQILGVTSIDGVFFTIAIRYDDNGEGSNEAMEYVPFDNETLRKVMDIDGNMLLRGGYIFLKDIRHSSNFDDVSEPSASMASTSFPRLSVLGKPGELLTLPDFMAAASTSDDSPFYEELNPPYPFHFGEIRTPEQQNSTMEANLIDEMQANALHSGILLRDFLGRDEWKERYFMLSHDKLWYCKKEGNERNLTFLELLPDVSCKIASTQTSTFTLETREGRILLRASSTPEMQLWMNKIDQRIMAPAFAHAEELIIGAERTLAEHASMLAEQDLRFMRRGCMISGCLQNPVLRDPFLEHLEGSETINHLLFWVHAESYFQQATLPRDKEAPAPVSLDRDAPPFGDEILPFKQRQIRARFIFENFLAEEAPYLIEADDDMYADIQEIAGKISKPQPHLFKALQDKVICFITRNQYPSFVQSPVFRKILCAAPHAYNQALKASSIFAAHRASRLITAPKSPLRSPLSSRGVSSPRPMPRNSSFKSISALRRRRRRGLPTSRSFEADTFIRRGTRDGRSVSPSPLSPEDPSTKRRTSTPNSRLSRFVSLGSMVSRMRLRSSQAIEKEWAEHQSQSKESQTESSVEIDLAEYDSPAEYYKGDPAWPPHQWWSSPLTTNSLQEAMETLPELAAVTMECLGVSESHNQRDRNPPRIRRLSPQETKVEKPTVMAVYNRLESLKKGLVARPPVFQRQWTGVMGWVRVNAAPNAIFSQWGLGTASARSSNKSIGKNASFQSLGKAGGSIRSSNRSVNTSPSVLHGSPLSLRRSARNPSAGDDGSVNSAHGNSESWMKRYVALQSDWHVNARPMAKLYFFKKQTPNLAHHRANTFSCTELIHLSASSKIEPEPELLQCITLTDTEGFKATIKIESADECEPFKQVNRWIRLMRHFVMPSCEVVYIVMEGFLMKRGKINTGHKRRWFRLDSRKMFRYYHDSNGIVKGELEITDETEIDAEFDSPTFTVKAGERCFTLTAPGKAREVTTWVQALEAVRRLP